MKLFTTLLSLFVAAQLFGQNAPASDSLKLQEDSLKKAALFLEPVEIKAIRASDNAPFAKTNITRQEIRDLNLGRDLPFLINQTPSLVVNSDAGNGVGYTGLRIRGSDPTRINMTINGIPYNDAESQGLFFVNLPDLASSVRDIQIQRGIGTSSNGAGAFGATINFSTNEVNDQAYAEINNSVGSFNTWKNTVKAGSGLIDGHFTVDARLSRISSDGYVDRASTNLGSYYLSGAYLSKKSSLRLNVFSGKEKTYQAWNGIPESDLKTNRTFNYSGTEKPGEPYDNETDNYQQDHYQLFFNHRFSNDLTFNTALFLTRGKGYYENYKANQSYSDYGLPDFAPGNDTLRETDLVRQLWLDNYFYGQIISLNYKHRRGTLTLGGGWNHYKGHHFGEIPWAEAGIPVKYRWYDLTSGKTDVNAYAKYQFQITTGLEGFADLQYRNINYDLNGFRNNPDLLISNSYHFFNPKFGLTYSLQHFRVFASFSRAAKEPNRDDYEAGMQQQPKPEKMNDIEAGIEGKYRNISWGATLYYMKYKDQLILTGQINDVGAYTRVNIPESYRAGVELQGSAIITSWLNVGANLALSKNKLTNFTEYYDNYDEGNQQSKFYLSSDIAFSPAVVGGYSLNILPFKNFTVNFSGKYVSRQYLDNTSQKTRSLNAYFVQDLRLAYNLPLKIFKSTELLLQVNNLFNKKYEANGYTYSYRSEQQLVTQNYYFPMATLNFMFGLNISL